MHPTRRQSFAGKADSTLIKITHSFVNDATNLNIYLKEIVGGFTFLDVSGEGGLGEDPRWDVGGWSSQGCRRRIGCCRCPSAP